MVPDNFAMNGLINMSAEDGTYFHRTAEEKLKLASYHCFQKMDASGDNYLNKETGQLLPLHMPQLSKFYHSTVKNTCISVTVGLSNYIDN